MGKNICCKTNESVERAKTFGRRTNDLKVLLSMKKCGNKDLEDPTEFLGPRWSSLSYT